jgi:DNA-binding response OmpR family regulator
MSRGDTDISRRLTRNVPPERNALSVLFVDPDIQFAERLASVLRGRCAVAIVPTAQAAMAAMRTRIPTLIVTELDLPDRSGLDLLTALHAAPATRNVLLLVVTGRRGVGDKVAAFQAGADDYLVKPVDPYRFETQVQLLIKFRQIFPG